MADNGLKVARKNTIFKDISLDFAERALVVSYCVESVMVDASGKSAGTDTSNSKKRIRLTSLDGDTDVPALAEAIMQSAKIIPDSKRDLLVELLYELQLAHTRSGSRGGGGAENTKSTSGSSSSNSNANNSTGSRVNSAGGRSASGDERPKERGSSSSSSSSTSSSRRTGEGKEPERSERTSSSSSSSRRSKSGGGGGTGNYEMMMQQEAQQAQQIIQAEEQEEIHADLNQVEEYLEWLYEEDAVKKADGAKHVLALAMHPENLHPLIGNVTLIKALSRVLKEDYRKSTSLTLTLMQMFFCIARFRDLHQTLLSNHIGDMCMRILDLEQRRHAARVLDLERFATLAMLQSKNDVPGEAAFRKVDAEARQREEEEEALAAGGGGHGGSDSKAAEESEAGGVRKRRGKRGGGDAQEGKTAEGGGRGSEEKRPIKLRPLPDGKVKLSSERRKTLAAVRKSECLSYVCLYILMHLAEDISHPVSPEEMVIERTMCKRGIVGLLTPLLERDNAPLLLLAVNFLRKLSIFKENKDAMVAQGAGTKLVAILPEPAQVPLLPPGDTRIELYASVLHLCFNLTFDAAMCQAFVTAGALRKVGAMLRVSPFRAAGLKLLYCLSTDNVVRGQFAGTDAVAYTLSMAAKFPQPRLPPELSALAINMTMHQATAEPMTKPDAIRALVARLSKTGDPAIAKILRSISQYTYGIQADAELKSHAMEDMKRLLARNAAMMGAAAADGGKKKKKNSKKKRSGKNGEEDGKGGEDDDAVVGGGGNGNSASAPPSTSLAGTYIPEPDTPIPYDYPYQDLWANVVHDIVRLVKNAESSAAHDVLVELLGLIGNLTPRDYPDSLPCAALTDDADFMGVVTRKLNPAAVNGETDLILEAIQVVSALALDPVSAPSLAASAVPRLLADVLDYRTPILPDPATIAANPANVPAEGAVDADLVMQTVTCIGRLLHHHETRDVIVSGSKVPMRLAELADVAHDRLAAEVDDCLYIMIEHDREFGTTGLWQHLQQKRFVIHNAEWLHMAETTAWHPSMASRGGGGSGGGSSNNNNNARGGAGAHPGGYDAHDDALLARRHAGAGGVGTSAEGPDAYVADDDYEAEPPAAEEDARSPLHHMGKHGEAVAFDVSYLFHQQHGHAGAESRPLVSDRPGLGAPYDYAEDVDALEDDDEEGEGGERRGGRRNGEDDDDDDDDGGEGEEIGDDVRALMDQYMHAAPGNSNALMGGGGGGNSGGGGSGARGMLSASSGGGMMKGGGGNAGLVGGAVQVRPHVLGPRSGVGAGMTLGSGRSGGLDISNWETGED